MLLWEVVGCYLSFLPRMRVRDKLRQESKSASRVRIHASRTTNLPPRRQRPQRATPRPLMRKCVSAFVRLLIYPSSHLLTYFFAFFCIKSSPYAPGFSLFLYYFAQKIQNSHVLWCFVRRRPLKCPPDWLLPFTFQLTTNRLKELIGWIYILPKTSEKTSKIQQNSETPHLVLRITWSVFHIAGSGRYSFYCEDVFTMAWNTQDESIPIRKGLWVYRSQSYCLT